MTNVCVVLIFWLVMTSYQGHASPRPNGQKLILMLLDGFRWDYVDRFDLPNFKRFYTKGARAKAMTSDFTTMSYPNHYSIATGLHTESHGLTGNYMYDKNTGDTFELAKNPGHLHPRWWEGAVPIWVSVEKEGLTGYTFHWPGTEVVIHGTQPSWSIPYKHSPTIPEFRSAVKDGVAVLKNGTAQYVGIYYLDSDSYGHKYGPTSSQLGAKLKSLDTEMGILIDLMEGQTPEDKINLMVVSDHGMTDVSESRVINITSSDLPENLYEIIMDRGPIIYIYLQDLGKQDEVYAKLANFHPNMTVYKRQDIPERWRCKKGRYMSSLIAVADLGWSILHPQRTDLGLVGHHGYDNIQPDMRGIFYAMGPYFKAGSSVESVHVVDLYNVMCGILGITPRPNNGTIHHVTPLLLKSTADSFQVSSQITGILAFISVVHFILLF